jgi:hypothetical protein
MISVEKLERFRQLARTGRRFDDNIKMDVK